MFQGACLDAIAPGKNILTDIDVRLELKEKNFQVFIAATPAKISDLWTALLSTDTTVLSNSLQQVLCKGFDLTAAEIHDPLL